MSTTTYTATPADLAMIQEAIGHTVKAAAQMGVIVTIDLVPQRPLAMGNYAARINVWPQRDSAVLRLLQVEYSQRIPIDENIGHISIPTGLHPATAELVQRFATALAAKLRSAERQHGYRDGWQQPGWMDKCRDQLLEHLAKGDPRDVAAYCAFLWHHGEHTSGLPTTPPGVPEPILQALRFYARQEHYHVDDSTEPVNEFDTVSGEPANWLHSMNDGDVTMIEDGSVARMALRGQVLNWIDGGEDETPAPIEGEATKPAAPHAELSDYYVHTNCGGATFFKTAEFFASQGGLTQDWGKAWRLVQASSIEDARRIGALPAQIEGQGS